MDRKRYVIRLEENIENYIQQQATERGMRPVNVIKNIIADRKQQDERERRTIKCT